MVATALNKGYSIKTTRGITLAALFMALSILFSSYGIPVPGGHIYLVDAIICTAAILFDPLSAMAIGGIGAFLGDMIFYPAPMFVSLVVHGLQGFAISWIAHNTFKNKPMTAVLLGLAAGCLIMVGGYFIGKIFVYSTYEYAIISLPYEIAQAVIGAIAGWLVCYPLGLKKIADRIMKE